MEILVRAQRPRHPGVELADVTTRASLRVHPSAETHLPTPHTRQHPSRYQTSRAGASALRSWLLARSPALLPSPHRDPRHHRLLHSLRSPWSRKPPRRVTLQWWCILATLTVTVTVTVTTIASAAGSIQMSSFSPRSLRLLVPPQRGLVMLRPSRALCSLSYVLLRHSCCQHLLLQNQQQN